LDAWTNSKATKKHVLPKGGVIMKDRTRTILIITFGIGVFFLGTTIALVSYGLASPFGPLLQSLGFALIVTSVMSVFQETVLSRIRKDDTKDGFDRVLRANKEGLDRILEDLHGPGIHILSPERAGYDAYHHWLVHTTPEDMFFAGHSVLHRVQIDLTKRDLGRIEERIVTRLEAGSRIRVIFLEPTWDFIKNIAESEHQPYEKMMTDLAITLGICRRLWTELEDKHPVSGSIHIWMCKEIQQYAFHSGTNRETGASQLLVGLYFANMLGMNSPLFAVDHKDIQDTFTAHFTTIAKRSVSLLEYSPPIKHFNHDLYFHCRDALCKAIDQSLVDQHCPI
jgi:hypothetical protein